MVTSADYRHVPTGTLAVLAQRLRKVSASPSTWYRLVRAYGWRRPRRVHTPKPKVGLRTTGPDEMWYIDTTVNRPSGDPPSEQIPLPPREEHLLCTTALDAFYAAPRLILRVHGPRCQSRQACERHEAVHAITQWPLAL